MKNRKHDIERYLRGELSPAEMHALEKDALSDPFLAEALEGVEQAGADNFLYDLHKINRSVHDRMRKHSRRNNKVISMWGWVSAVAATLLLVAVSGFLMINILRDQRASEKSIANTPEPTPESSAGASDSLTVNNNNTPLAALDKKQEEPAKPAGELKKDGGPAGKPRPEQPTAKPEQSSDRKTESARDEVIADKDRNDDTEEVTDVKPDAIASEESARQAPGAEQPARAKEQQPSEALKGKVSGVQSGAPVRSGRYSVESTRIRGKVTDETGEELPGVNVTVQGTDKGTVTDGEGHYELDVPPGAKLVFGFIGFEATEVAVNDTTEVNVTLEEDISTLSEVVVTGFGSEKDANVPASFRSAEPSGGKNDFKSYLSNSIKYPQQAIKNKKEGKVTIRFTVEPTGQLTDFEVVKGIGFGCEEELIRAIRQGPYWKPSTQGNQPVRDKVRVRYKFELPK